MSEAILDSKNDNKILLLFGLLEVWKLEHKNPIAFTTFSCRSFCSESPRGLQHRWSPSEPEEKAKEVTTVLFID